MNAEKIRADLRNTGDKHLVEVADTVSDEGLAFLRDMFNTLTDDEVAAVQRKLAN